MAHKEPNLPFRWDVPGGDRTGSLTEGIDYDPTHVDELAEWTNDLPASSVRNVSIGGFLWSHLGNSQPKTEASFRRTRWSDPAVTRPRHDERARQGLADALSCHEHGRTRRVRSLVHRVLTGEPTFRDPWLRTLAHDLRASGGTSHN